MKTLILTMAALLALGFATISGGMDIPPQEDCIKSEYGGYSYLGHIDPQKITRNWILLEELSRPVPPSGMEIYYKNPESPCEIPVAVFLVSQEGFLGFGYLHGGNVYLYLFDFASKCYIGKQLEGDAEPRFKKKLGEALGQKSL